jgi:signal transduction histidine kinase
VHDLTEQKAAAEQIAELAEERMRRQASEMASSAKSEFLSRVSHEMRTPLNAVIGFAQLLQMPQGADNGKAVAYSQHIRAAGEHLLALVTDLLDLNRTAQGTLQLVPQALALAEVVDECLHLLENLGRTHGIELRADVPAELRVLADPTRLRQVLINLGSNAVKYNREGGSVQVRAQRFGSGRIRLTVEDSGIGMTPEQLDRLFQPFDRLGRERSKIPGIGLGLVIARGLVQEMGGTLEVASQPRAGTTVTIELPSAP